MSATVLMLPASTISLSAKLCHFPVRGRGVRGDARTPRLDAHNHHLPSLPRRDSLSRIASQEGEIQPQGWVGGGLPASVLVVALPLWPIAAQCFELLGSREGDHRLLEITRDENLHTVAIEADKLAQETCWQKILALMLLLDDDLG